MKATGIVRRIDDLGRVVIPKEIRRTMRIREGDPLEIFTDHEGEVIFKKYSPISELAGVAAQYAEALNKTTNLSIVIIDKDAAVAAAGAPKKEIVDQKISRELESLIENRQLYSWKENDAIIPVTVHSEKYFVRAAMPIFTEGDIIGAVTITGSENITPVTDNDVKLIQTAALFLGKQLEP